MTLTNEVVVPNICSSKYIYYQNLKEKEKIFKSIIYNWLQQQTIVRSSKIESCTNGKKKKYFYDKNHHLGLKAPNILYDLQIHKRVSVSP